MMPPKITTKLSKNKTRSDDYSFRHHSDANELGSHSLKHVPCLFASFLQPPDLIQFIGCPVSVSIPPLRLLLFAQSCRANFYSTPLPASDNPSHHFLFGVFATIFSLR